MNLYLIRHTKVQIPRSICYGYTDVDVADTFNEEIIAIKEQIDGIVFDKVWASPLQRCSKLADVLFPGEEVQYDFRLKELNFGDWEEKAWADIYDEPGGEEWMNDYVNRQCPNGESFSDQIKRVAAFYEEMKSTFENKNIAIVSHGGTIRSFHCHLKGIKPEDAFNFAFDYGSVNKLIIEEKMP